ncbi:hypothetical protein KC19_9G127500 [Ceratodon purpureus]|uniref:Uncharacterized protein n=1 Tax=Ceratodon purpureus TaxID=3225 RepID=A0A8T0GRE9_CERPU|nr:hypothetical protein KC19_9G127500 [Ceratodon purpureus]
MVKIELDPTQDVCMDNHFQAGVIVSKMKLVCLACGCRLTLSGARTTVESLEAGHTDTVICPGFENRLSCETRGCFVEMKHPYSVHITVASCHQSMVRVHQWGNMSTWVQGEGLSAQSRFVTLGVL